MMSALFSDLTSYCRQKKEKKDIWPSEKVVKQKFEASRTAGKSPLNGRRGQEQQELGIQTFSKYNGKRRREGKKVFKEKKNEEDAWNFDESFESGDKNGERVELRKSERGPRMREKGKPILGRVKSRLGKKAQQRDPKAEEKPVLGGFGDE